MLDNRARPIDHDLRIRTPAHWPDTLHWSTDQEFRSFASMMGTANTWWGWARHDARPGSRSHRAGAVEKEAATREGRPGDDLRACFLVAGAGPLRLGQDLTCSAVLAGVALLLAHRDHEPSCEASDDGQEPPLAAGDDA
jgi:hypothetical protein